MSGGPVVPPGPTAVCPRCGDRFHCGAGDPAPCVCSGLDLPAALLATLRRDFDGCLCLRCLQALAAAACPDAAVR